MAFQPFQFNVPRLGGGQNDAPNMNAAIANAITYAQNNQLYAEVLTLDASGPYLMNSAPTIGGTTKGNAILPLPVIATTAAKPVIRFRGATSGAGADSLLWFQQNAVQLAGTVWQTTRTDGTFDASNGPSSILGGPVNGFGGEPGTFDNLLVIIDGIQCVVPYNGTYSGFDFFGVAQAHVVSGGCMALGTATGTGGTNISNPANITNTGPAGTPISIGLRMPCAGNNDKCDVGYWSAEGLCYGFMPSEHTVAESVRCIYCVIGVEGYAGNGVSMAHGARIKYASVENCSQSVGFFDGVVKLDIDTLDNEGGANVIFDPTNKGQGTIHLRGQSSGYFSGGIVNGGTGVRILILDQASGPVASPQAPPANNAAWVNGYYRDAWITLSATTITAVKIGTVAQNGLAGSPATYTFLLPAGQSYTPTFTGALTHTVTLI